MATLSRSETRRLYSWWWDSHISPKNSKWLQENLLDMDSKVKAMIRLIEEDGESFAQRAEMFYKKRPELMKLVEEFYRAYRALAERYNHATDALGEAHRKMAEAFPNEIPLEFSDGPQPEYSSVDEVPDILEMNIGFFLPDDLQRALPTGKITLKQLQDMFTGTKEVKFQDKEGKCSDCKLLVKENQDLKNQIIYESARANEYESEVQRLREDSSKAVKEKEDAVFHYEEAKARISYLEHEISCMQADVEKSDNGDQINHTIEKANEVFISELEELKQRIVEQQKELNTKEELQKLCIALKDEQKQKIEGEIACRSNEKKLFECEEKLKAAQLSKRSLEEAIQNIRRENEKLNEEKLSSALKIINLQDEIISFRGPKGKLHDELSMQAKEKAAIQQEQNCLKEDRDNLEKRYYHGLMEEIQLVNSNVQFLQEMIRDLRDGNFELKETIKRQEGKKSHLLNIQHIGKLSEKNATSKNTISDAKNEREIFGGKLKTLEDSYYYLHGKVSINQAEKPHLMSHAEAVSNDMGKPSGEDLFLEKSLCDMNPELDDLLGKLKGLEESSHSPHDEKSTLLLEKMVLTAQVENISQSLKILEKTYAALEGKHSTLQKEKNSALQQVEELHELLNIEKEEHNAFVQSSNSQLSGLANQIQQLEEEGRQREEELELERIKVMNAQIEIFVLQRSLRDMTEGNLILSVGSKKHQGSLKCSEKLILELEEEHIAEKNKIESITENNENLREWIHSIVQLLKIDLECISLDNIKDEVLMQLILREIKCLLCTISEAQEEKHHLHHEKSVAVTLLKQVGAYVEDLQADKAALTRESKSRNEEFGLLKNKNDKFFLMNEQLREKLQASNQREEALKAELHILYQQLSSLQIKITSMHEEKDKLEKENNILISDVMAMDFFSLTLQSLIAEKGLELQLLIKERNQLHKAQKYLDGEIRVIREKTALLQAKKPCISQSIPEMENYINLEGEDNTSNEMQLARKDRNKNCNYLELDVNLLKLEKEEYSSSKGINILHVHHEKSIAKGETNGSLKHAEELRCREKYLPSTLNGMDELSSCDVEIILLSDGISLTTCNVESLEAKVDELIKACRAFEHSSMVHMHTLQGEIRQRNFTISQQKEELNILDKENQGLKADLDSYLLLMRSLWDEISLLEEQAVSPAKRHISTKNQKEKAIQMKFPTNKNQNSPVNYGTTKTPGSMKLQDLHSKNKILKQVVAESGRLLQLERLASTTSMDSAWSETEGISKDIQQEEAVKMNCAQIKGDAQLHIVLNSSNNRNSDLSGRLQNTKRGEIYVSQVSELCRMTKETCSNQNQKTPLAVSEHDTVMQHHDEVNDCCYSLIEPVAEKELAVNKPESYQDWISRVMHGLSSDGRRLLVLQASVRKLQNNIEESERIKHPTSALEHVKEQLKEAESSISKLIDTNHKLTIRVEHFPAPSDRLVSEKKDDGSGSGRRSQITDQARKESEKIARLEIEMQKIQCSMLKGKKEDNMKRTKFFYRRSGILLKHYIFGKRNSWRQKKGSCCGRCKSKY